MVSVLKKCIGKLFSLFFSFKSKRIKKLDPSAINSYQDASLGILLNTYNNINHYNIVINNSNKSSAIKKIQELEEMKNDLKHALSLGVTDESRMYDHI